MAAAREGLAIRAWEMMGGELNWPALPLIVELLVVDDVSIFVTHLCAIRDHLARKAAADRG